MKKLFLTVALSFVFAVLGYADRCSDLCKACKESPKDVSTCCQALSCNKKCVAAQGNCPIERGGGGNGDDYNNNNRQHFPARNERQVRQEAREAVDRAIHNFQNFQQQQGLFAGVQFGLR
jgi:hypothetical protein